MGNEGSKLQGLLIDKTAVEANDFFVLFNAIQSKPAIAKNKANSNNKNTATAATPTNFEEGRVEKLSVFQAERGTFTQTLWGRQGPMKHAIKNYMIYRHPYLLKYIATWDQSGDTFLATERVRPLTGILNAMQEISDIQICLGLRNVLCGLIFLTEKASACHLNVCPASIYITESGAWRLAGFEYVWKSNELKVELIELLNQYRHKSAIDPDELKNADNRNTIEQYAFAVLCEEILSSKAKCKHISDCDTPHTNDFREYCATVLRHKKPDLRPKLSAILLHPYFNHEFILIHSFLFELPLKSLPEKQIFFSSLVERLRYFSEAVVASQMACDLLSRMVLLDPTAQLCVTPYVLKTKNVENAALFGKETYLKHVMPHIKRMFRLRDAQIRLILLEYFMEYVRLLTEADIKEFIMPHLLLGIKDTNDVLVAKTLRCLADLVPILGASEVLASLVNERCRLFSDGRPTNSTAVDSAVMHWVEPRSITPVLSSVQDNREINGAISVSDDEVVGYMVSASPEVPDNVELSDSFNAIVQLSQVMVEMPPRLSPDGGEDDKCAVIDLDLQKQKADESLSNATKENHINENVQADDNDDDDAWSDWEAENNEKQTSTFEKEPAEPAVATTNSTTPITRITSKHIIDDINSFDIQIQKTANPTTEKRDEFDFFKDMEPVIKRDTHNLSHDRLMEQNEDHEELELIRTNLDKFAAIMPEDNLLQMNALDSNANDGWDVGEDDYND